MPRIDPIQLLNCLGVLLSPNGGIKSRNEVQRLAGLMTKFSKKLVSKCIYVQILKYTETDLLGLFMGSGGWFLAHMWLTESIVAKNWPLVKELLELLLLCPVDIERLKTNNCPKLVKELSKDENQFAIRALALKLVEQWLKTVKGEQVIPLSEADIAEIVLNAESDIPSDIKSELKSEPKSELKYEFKTEINIKVEEEEVGSEKENTESKIRVKNEDFRDAFREDDTKMYIKKEVDTKMYIKKEVDMTETKEKVDERETLPVLKISVKDGKQVISKIDDESKATPDADKNKDKTKSKHKEKSSDKTSSSSKSRHSSSRSHSSSDKHRSSRSSSSSSSKTKDIKEKDKDRHTSHSSKSRSDSKKSSSSDKSNSSNKSKDDRNTKSDKEKNKDRDKDKDKLSQEKQEKRKSIDKLEIQTPSIHKLGKIPKLSDLKKDKPSISIEVRKPDEPKPKTVKTFHSKFRKHGLEEEVKPPPSRATILNKKVIPILPPTVSIPKRPSPVHNDHPPEKKPKTVEPVEKPGAIKLIPPKPKPIMLLESDMFMDALNASATNKKEPKKRKRRTSGSKDGNNPNDGSPPHTPVSASSPNSENKSVPPRFYQDTLETEDSKEKSAIQSPERKEISELKSDEKEPEQSMEIDEPHTRTINGLKGVLCYHRRKGPKKSIKWKSDSELEEIQYFELDETERVNVTKTFTDMKHLERVHEREAFEKARNLSTDDVMEEKTSWRPLMLIDAEGQIHVEYGKNSKEKDIQAIRQKGTLQPLYFHKSMIPDSPTEPDVETHTYLEPTIIPLDDISANQDNISDFRNMPWPEPKGNAPPPSNNVAVAPMFPPNMGQFSNGFPNPQFPGVPGFQGPNMPPADWPNGMPPHIIANNIPGPMNPAIVPGVIPPGNLPPGMLMPSEGMMMSPEMFGVGGPNPMFPGPPDAFNMQPNMFPMEFNMPGPQGPGPEGFSGPGYRGPMRGGRGNGGHWRGKSSGNWDGGPQRGRGGHARGNRKTVCIYFQRKGSCRQGDNCSFLHPGVNCPY